MTNSILMTKCADMNEAIELHDRNNDHGFYECFENERAAHERFYAKYPEMASQWLYSDDTGEVYHVSTLPDGQRLINKHSLTSSLSNGKLKCVIADYVGDTLFLSIMPNTVSKYDRELRRGWCRIQGNNFLTGDL